MFIAVPSHKPEVKFEENLSRKHDSFSFQECLIIPIRETGPASAVGNSPQAVFDNACLKFHIVLMHMTSHQ